MAKIDQSIEWKNRVSACRSSGLSIRKWCELHEVKYAQFYCWWKKFIGVEMQSSCQWLPVVLFNEKEEPSSLLVHVGDATIESHHPFDQVLFPQVMKAMNERLPMKLRLNKSIWRKGQPIISKFSDLGSSRIRKNLIFVLVSI